MKTKRIAMHHKFAINMDDEFFPSFWRESHTIKRRIRWGRPKSFIYESSATFPPSCPWASSPWASSGCPRTACTRTRGRQSHPLPSTICVHWLIIVHILRKQRNYIDCLLKGISLTRFSITVFFHPISPLGHLFTSSNIFANAGEFAQMFSFQFVEKTAESWLSSAIDTVESTLNLNRGISENSKLYGK